MAGGHPPEPSGSPLSSPSDRQDPLAWCRRLQTACRLEVERDFPDLQGRQERFSSFIVRSLRSPCAGLPQEMHRNLVSLGREFSAYDTQPPARRRRLVARLRQGLQAVQRSLRPEPAASPPRLRLREPQPGPPTARQRAITPRTPLAQVEGIGRTTATRLAALGLLEAADLVRHYPRDYLDYSRRMLITQLQPGATATIVATVRRARAYRSPRNPTLGILELQLQDSSGRLRLSRFMAGRRYSQPAWLQAQQRRFPAGALVAVSGLVKAGPYGPAFVDPLIEIVDPRTREVTSGSIGRLVPVYSLTEGLSAERLRRAVEAVLPAVDHWPDPLDDRLRQPHELMPLAQARRQIHRPSDQRRLEEARRRLVFDEFLLLQLSLARRRRQRRQGSAPALTTAGGEGDLLSRFLEGLPFPLTGAQRRVLAEIRRDMARPRPMARLLQGDVGSGKTVVAVAALLVAVDAGCQGVLMAPTEVLAEQHLRSLARWLPALHVRFDHLSGSTPARRRRRLLDDLANGQVQVLVGTHAVLEDAVRFPGLGLVVVDEQHRFGVRQRDRLLAKGPQPHLLTMTATPIPRTLALSLHGDLEVSQIDELPPGRTPVRTRLLRASQRRQAHDLIREQVARGQRAYVVLPLVEESENLDLRSAVEMHAQLSAEVFPDLAVGLLHGRLRGEEKQRTITAFAEGRLQVLVSTTVVEVGVDVPEASVMLIEHAQRFGLAQLHQLRGRVGRGAAASHCLLIEDSGQAEARQRLEILVRSSDGFEIAEMDLHLRGPGQVLGTRQSGLPDFALARLREDGEVLELSRRVARSLLEQDPGLEGHPALRRALMERGRDAPARLN